MARSGLEVQKAAVKALFLREIKTRFGKYRLGYLWAALEPSAHVLVMLAIFGYVMHRTMPDISFPVFLINGIIPYFIFTNISNRSIGAIEANQGLFNYRPVKPIDTIISRTLLESMIYLFVYILLMSIVRVLGENYEVVKIITLIISWTLLIILSFGLGLIFMVIGNLYPELAKFLPILLKPLYFISCIMYPLHNIPKEYWSYILWNPIVHSIELSRESVFPGYISDGVSISYLSFCSLLLLFIGLTLYIVNEKRMLTSK